jgi:hypothetical protein
MYVVPFLIIVVIWAWFTGGSIYSWWERKIGVWLALGSVVVWTGIAGLFLLFVLPYGQAVYLILLQPG